MDGTIQLTDVTLRDGLQMESRPYSIEQKLEWLQSLFACGFSRLEFTSFVHPKWVPQFADADSFCERVFQIYPDPPTPLMAFVPNVRGLDRLLRFPIPWASAFVAVSEAFNKKNVNASVAESLSDLGQIAKRCQEQKRKLRIYISTVFGCPYQGAIEADAVAEVMKKVADLGPEEIALGDTIGVATPGQVEAVLEAVAGYFPRSAIALHLHNTYGFALASCQKGWEMGIRLFDGSVGGIGGCPYAKGASGNLALEDLAYFFWRQQAVPLWKPDAIQALQKLLEGAGLTIRSHLHEISRRGGVWFPGAPA